jgi:hypothetical protein
MGSLAPYTRGIYIGGLFPIEAETSPWRVLQSQTKRKAPPMRGSVAKVAKPAEGELLLQSEKLLLSSDVPFDPEVLWNDGENWCALRAQSEG